MSFWEQRTQNTSSIQTGCVQQISVQKQTILDREGSCKQKDKLRLLWYSSNEIPDVLYSIFGQLFNYFSWKNLIQFWRGYFVISILYSLMSSLAIRGRKSYLHYEWHEHWNVIECTFVSRSVTSEYKRSEYFISKLEAELQTDFRIVF